MDRKCKICGFLLGSGTKEICSECEELQTPIDRALAARRDGLVTEAMIEVVRKAWFINPSPDARVTARAIIQAIAPLILEAAAVKCDDMALSLDKYNSPDEYGGVASLNAAASAIRAMKE